MIKFTLTRASTAPIETVFDAMTDHRGIAAYMWACRRSTLDREGTPAPNGVGAIRRLVVIGPPFVEEVTEYERPTRYAYKMLRVRRPGITSARSNCGRHALSFDEEIS